MSPKIHPIQSLALDQNGHMEIAGPINTWDPTALAMVVTVVVSQVTGTTNGSPDIAMAIGWSGAFTPASPGPDWTATTRPVGLYQLQPGGAIVAAWATILDKDGGSEIYEWTLPVKFTR